MCRLILPDEHKCSKFGEDSCVHCLSPEGGEALFLGGWAWAMMSRYMQTNPRVSTRQSIHVLRLPYHSSSDFSLNRLLRWVQGKLDKRIPHLRLFVTHKPVPNVRAVWHRLAMHTLRESREGGRVEKFSSEDLEVKNTPELIVADLLFVAARAGAPPGI